MTKLKKILIVIAVLLVLCGSVFAFLQMVSPNMGRGSSREIPKHAVNIRKGTVVKTKKRRPSNYLKKKNQKQFEKQKNTRN